MIHLSNLFLVILCICLASVVTASSSSSSSCRFAHKYKQDDLLTNDAIREEFLAEVLRWERNFVRTIGIDSATQLTRDGQRLDYTTGLPLGPGHEFSAPSKESLHIAVLVLALDTNSHKGIANASIFFTPDEALSVLERKFETYEKFQKQFPGFGGYMPWYHFGQDVVNNVTTTVNVTPTWDWVNRCPLLDNGEMVWSLYALKYILESDEYPSYADQHPKLLLRVRHQWNSIVENLITMWYDETEGELCSVIGLSNQSLPVSQNTYTRTPGYLDDPYEGESASILFSLFANATEEQINTMWIGKRKKLQSATLTTPSSGNVTVMRGWWYSSHEKWVPSLLCPYRKSDVYRRVFVNGERARTIYSAAVRKSPGLFASVNGPIPGNNASFPYYSACGIQEVAFQQVLYDSVSTGYGAFPVFAAGIDKDATTNNAFNARGVAAAWLHNYLSAPKMQNRWGATESTLINGTQIAPLTTWDSKITTAVAILGGVVSIVERGFIADGKLDAFVSIIDREWTRVFGNSSTLPGENLPFAPPTRQFPKVLEDFTTCQ